jgi:chromate transporter
LLSFGGPAGQIALMHRILVDEKRWISEARFLHALNYCMLLPGPEAQQLATYIGWLLHRTRGGLVAGTLFIMPGFMAILALSLLYVLFEKAVLVQGLFFGLKAAVLAIIIQAVLRIGQRVLKNRVMLSIAAISFVSIYFFHVPFPIVIVAAAAIGMLGNRLAPEFFKGQSHRSSKSHSETPLPPIIDESCLTEVAPSWGRSLSITVLGLSLWFAPVLLIGWWQGWQSVFVQEAELFSKAALVTFGGAYSVLAYIGQQAVDQYEWLEPREMMDGLGMAETTPGPLIMVVQFVGFMAAYRNPGSLDPITAGILGSLVSVWVTFVPCFLWIFLGAPYIERLRSQQWISSALTAITAAVVGVIANLGIWFALHSLFTKVNTTTISVATFEWPTLTSVDPAMAFLAIGSILLLFGWRAGVITTLLASAISGCLIYLFSASRQSL